ncbi:20036_t:CDS:1, partial [Funneliformis geosporum]
SEDVAITNPLRISSQPQSRIRYKALMKEQQIRINTSYPLTLAVSISSLIHRYQSQLLKAFGH